MGEGFRIEGEGWEGDGRAGVVVATDRPNVTVFVTSEWDSYPENGRASANDWEVAEEIVKRMNAAGNHNGSA